jgi:hypothetical protein
MRKKYQKQMPLMITSIDHPHAAELEGISQILDANPIIYEWVLQDLTRNITYTGAGAEGMSAEQGLKAILHSKPCVIICHFP